MTDYKETTKVKYLCGCNHQIGLTSIGSWQPTGVNNNCEKHTI